jgi:CubicO group peptidase (beta-lactamase class C family)
MKRLLLVHVVLALLVLPTLPAHAASLPTAKPEEVGLSSAGLQRIGRVLKADVDSGRLAGAVVVVARKGRIAYLESVGFRDKAAGAPMTPDAIFRIASMTKPMVAVAAMMLYEEGRLFVADPVSKYFPALGKLRVGPGEGVPADREMTIQDLLRHTSGLTYGNRGTTEVHQMYPVSSNGASLELTGDEFIEKLGRVRLLYQPGTTWEYGLSTDVLGRVVEVVSKQTLGQFLGERLFRPLKMRDTGFVVPEAKRGRIAQALAADPETGKPITLPQVTEPRKFECGGGCGVSTAGDYIRFAQMLLNRGTLDGTRLLGRKTVEYMTADHLGTAVVRPGDLPGPGYGFGFSVAVRRDTGVANLAGSAGDYNWGGAFGTYFWVDPKENLTVVFMSQAPGMNRGFYRQLVKSAVLAAIRD